MKNIPGHDMKETLRNDILNIFDRRGYEEAKRKIDQIYRESGAASKAVGNSEALGYLRGELAEIALEINLRKHILGSENVFYVKGLVLEKSTKDKFTELDLTLFTGRIIVLFECKSYAGKKELHDECIIKRPGRPDFDVARQNKAHLTALYTSIRKFKISEDKGFKLALFDYSDKPAEDLRSKKCKTRFPCLNVDNIQTYLNSGELKGENVWDLEKVYAFAVEENEHRVEKFAKHIKNMKGG